MTYMSIVVHDCIRWGLDSGELVHARPIRPRTYVRAIIMTEEVAKLLNGPWESPDSEITETQWEYRCGFVHRYFDRFLNGKKVTVALDPR